MRIHSTTASIANGEVTLLAVIECILSIIVYVGTALYWNTVLHIAFAVALAPLFLLRTRYSYTLALGLYEKVWTWTGGPNSLRKYLFVVVYIFGVTIRMTATFLSIIRFPRRTISAIPNNWVRQTLCTDMFLVPEIIPGERYSNKVIITLYSLANLARQLPQEFKRDPIPSLAFSWAILITFVVGYVPAILLRISFKATSIAYFPLIFVARASNTSVSSVKWRLERFTKGELEKYRRRLSGIVLSLLVAKVAFAAGIIEQAYLSEMLGSERLATILVGRITWWHCSLAIDSVVTFAIFFYSDSAISRLEHSAEVHSRKVLTLVDSLAFLRGVTATATILYFFGVALFTVVRHTF
jgi:hypothetical protein